MDAANRVHRVVLIPGDGIGPEVTAAVRRVFEAAGAPVAWNFHQAGAVPLRAGRELFSEETIEAIRHAQVALKGPCTTPVGEGFTSINVQLRKRLNLYAAVRPVRNLEGVPARFQGVDLIIVRENTEGLYSGVENQVTDGLFLRCARKVHEEDYPNIDYQELIIDAGCMKLVQDPSQFDVLLLENLYGDVVSDLCAGLVGGLGVVPGANIGDELAVFEAVHGSAPDIAGQGVANPLALLMSGVMMLNHLAETRSDPRCRQVADRIKAAYNGALADGQKTRDLGGSLGTEAFADAVIAHLELQNA
jgi:isocitrate dehydrogenase (NAD+)